MRGNKNQRKGISPIIATLTLVAITLVAAVAIGGFVFGVFGSQTSTPQVSVTYVYIPSTVENSTLTVTANQTEAGDNYGVIMVQNVGAANVGISGVSLTYAGSTAYAPLTSVTLESGKTQTIYITSLPQEAVAGQQFTGAVILSNGVQVPFTGTFA